MKRNAKLTAILAAGTAAAVGGVLAAGPVAAAAGGTGPTPSTTSGYSKMMGGGSGTGNTTNGSGGSSMMGSGSSGYSGMMGGSADTGTGTGSAVMSGGMSGMMGASGVGMMGAIAITAPSGTLNPAQRAALARIAEQQQLTHDLFQAFATRYNSTMLDHTGDVATYQLDAVRTLMTRYGVTDPTAGKAAGTYTDPATQSTYNRLLAQGQGGYDNALTALSALETAHVAALTGDLSGLTAPDARQVYTRLLVQSEMYQGMSQYMD